MPMEKSTKQRSEGRRPAVKIGEFSHLKGNDCYQTLDTKWEIKYSRKSIKKKIHHFAEFFSYQQWPLSWERPEMGKYSGDSFSVQRDHVHWNKMKYLFLLNHCRCGFPWGRCRQLLGNGSLECFLSFQKRAKTMIPKTTKWQIWHQYYQNPGAEC